MGYQSITHRFLCDETFKFTQLEAGRTIHIMREYDRIASLPATVKPIPYQQRLEKWGDRHEMVLAASGKGTHRIQEAPNYHELLAQGPPEPPPRPQREAPPKGKGRTKGQDYRWKGSGRSHSNPYPSHRRSPEYTSWHPDWWQGRRW